MNTYARTHSSHLSFISLSRNTPRTLSRAWYMMQLGLKHNLPIAAWLCVSFCFMRHQQQLLQQHPMIPMTQTQVDLITQLKRETLRRTNNGEKIKLVELESELERRKRTFLDLTSF